MSENLLTDQAGTESAGSCCGSCGTSASSAAPAATEGVRETFRVEGMTCGHCVSSVTAELKTIAGVHEVTVDLATGLVTVDSEQPLEQSAVAAAIDEAGYELVGRVSA